MFMLIKYFVDIKENFRFNLHNEWQVFDKGVWYISLTPDLYQSL